MIITHQHFNILEKCILERIVFTPPIRKTSVMENEACFLYSVNGESTLYSANQKIKLTSKDGVVLKCGSYLQNHYKASNHKPYEKVAVHFHPEVLKLIYKNELPSFLKNKSAKKVNSIEPVKVNEMIGKYIESLLFYFENPTLVTDELIILKVKELLLLLINTDNSEPIQNILKDLFNPIEFDFKKNIEAYLYSPLSISELALLSNLSISTFKRTFKLVFKDSPAHYIKVKRLEKSAELLKITSDRISDICYDCGFSSIGHFSKCFTTHFNVSPTEYRASI